MKVDVIKTASGAKKAAKKAIQKRNITRIVNRQTRKETNKLYATATLERHAETMDPEEYIKARSYLANAEREYYINDFIL